MAVDHRLRLELGELPGDESSDWFGVTVMVNDVKFIAPGAVGMRERDKEIEWLSRLEGRISQKKSFTEKKSLYLGNYSILKAKPFTH